MDSLKKGPVEYRFVFNEETLREALAVTAIAAVKGTMIAQSKSSSYKSYESLLKEAARALDREGRTGRTEAVFGLADCMIANLKAIEKGVDIYDGR